MRDNRTAFVDGHRRHVALATINKVLLHWLGPKHCATRLLSCGGMGRGWDRADWRQVRAGNLVGIGFGLKEVSGDFTDQTAVRIYVKRKLARRELSARERLPPIVDDIATDVIELGQPVFHARPIALGAGISHAQGGRGSLGCVLTKPGDDSWYLLSACHVLALAGRAAPGDAIMEPAARDEGGTPDGNAARLATLEDFEGLRQDGTANPFDAAIARLDRKADVTIDIPIIGPPQGPTMPAVLFQSVRKYGAGTGPTIGVVTDTSSHVTLMLDDNSYFFSGVIQVTGAGSAFSTGGDSGALVVDAMTRRPVGLIIGGVGARTFVSPLEPVLSRFGAQLLQ